MSGICKDLGLIHSTTPKAKPRSSVHVDKTVRELERWLRNQERLFLQKIGCDSQCPQLYITLV